jgi:hypothetical protein
VPTDFPFQILFLGPGETSPTFEVDPGTMFYVPVLFVDNAEPILGDFPNVNDPEAISDYYFNPEQLGAEFIEVVVDGEVTSLGPEYVVGTEAPGLGTGGDRYTTVAVFLTPLPPGTHTVTIRARFTGEAFEEFPTFFPEGVFEFELTYTVIVE